MDHAFTAYQLTCIQLNLHYYISLTPITFWGNDVKMTYPPNHLVTCWEVSPGAAGVQVSVLCVWLPMAISPLGTEMFPFQKSREDGKNEQTANYLFI